MNSTIQQAYEVRDNIIQAFDKIGNELALVAKTTIEALLKGSNLAYNKR